MPTDTITAPMPGVFYRRPDPDEAPFVEEGDDIDTGTVVGIIGVMKNFHEIEAEADGVVGSFLVDNEEEIMTGDAIVEIETG